MNTGRLSLLIQDIDKETQWKIRSYLLRVCDNVVMISNKKTRKLQINIRLPLGKKNTVIKTLRNLTGKEVKLI